MIGAKLAKRLRIHWRNWVSVRLLAKPRTYRLPLTFAASSMIASGRTRPAARNRLH